MNSNEGDSPIEAPWVYAPGLDYSAGNWRQGNLDGYIGRWKNWIITLPKDEALSYLRNIDPPENGHWAYHVRKFLKHLEDSDWDVLQLEVQSFKRPQILNNLKPKVSKWSSFMSILEDALASFLSRGRN